MQIDYEVKVIYLLAKHISILLYVTVLSFFSNDFRLEFLNVEFSLTKLSSGNYLFYSNPQPRPMEYSNPFIIAPASWNNSLSLS